MMHKIETSAGGLELNETINGYVQQKIGDLDRYLQRHARKTVHAEVKLWKEKGKGGRGYTAFISLISSKCIHIVVLKFLETNMNIHSVLKRKYSKISSSHTMYSTSVAVISGRLLPRNMTVKHGYLLKLGIVS